MNLIRWGCWWEFFGEIIDISNLIKIGSFSSPLKDLTKSHIKVKSGDLSIMHDHNVMPRGKLSSDWLSTHVTEQGFR